MKKYKVINRVSGNSHQLNQEQFDRFFDNNTRYDYRVYNMESLRVSRLQANIGYGLIVLGISAFLFIQLLKII